MKNTIKNTTMKNILNIVIVAFVALALTLTTTSCKKENVNPSTPNNNTAPTVVASIASNIITVTATDADGSISKVEILNGSSVVSTLTTAPFTYSVASLSAGNYTYTIKAYDDKNAITSTTISFTITSSNTAPTFSSTSLKVISDGSAQTFPLPVSDLNGNTITITSITGASANVAVTYSGLNVTVTPNNSIFAGAETLTITITDGTDATSSSFTVNVGETAQINTYNTLSPFFKSLTGDLGNITLNKGSIVTTMTQSSGGFFNSAASAGAYNYKILTSGNVEFTAGANKIEYTISVASNVLTFTRVSNGDVYNVY